MRSERHLDRRSVMGSAAAAAIAGLAGCAGLQTGAEDPVAAGTDPWPDPKEGQREVMLLGTSHLAQTLGDTANTYATDPGDVLGDAPWQFVDKDVETTE